MPQPLAHTIPAPPFSELITDLRALLHHHNPGQSDFIVALLAWAAAGEEEAGA